MLGSLVKKFEHPKLNELKPLTSDDPEVDFFENIVHIQVIVCWCIYCLSIAISCQSFGGMKMDYSRRKMHCISHVNIIVPSF